MLTILALLALAPAAQAQKHDYVWVFGDSCGLDFNAPGGSQFFVSNRIGDGSTGENCPTLADADGRLLAFAEYYREDPGGPWLCRLKHADGSVIPGGGALYGQAWSQAFFLPVSGRNDAYYFICLDRRPGNLHEDPLYLPEGLYLNRIEFDGNESRVVTANQLLARGDFDASMIAIPHADGNSWWLISHEVFSNRFVTFLFTDGEISEPVYRAIGRWDGRAENGTFVPQGVYGYALEAEGYAGRKYFERGTITVIR